MHRIYGPKWMQKDSFVHYQAFLVERLASRRMTIESLEPLIDQLASGQRVCLAKEGAELPPALGHAILNNMLRLVHELHIPIGWIMLTGAALGRDGAPVPPDSWSTRSVKTVKKEVHQRQTIEKNHRPHRKRLACGGRLPSHVEGFPQKGQ